MLFTTCNPDKPKVKIPVNYFSKLLSRQKILLGIIVTFLLFGCSPRDQGNDFTVNPMDHRPNIIFILADDLDQKLGTTQYMANLNEYLTKRGTTVDNFIVTTPMCCPSRVNILRGQYTHNHEVFNNEAPTGGFPKFYESGKEISTLPVWLQAAGYRTALIGKYLNAYPLVEDRTYVPPGWSEWYSPGRKNAYDGYDYYLNENGKLVPYPPTQANFFTDVMSRKAVDFIERSADDKTPFFLYLAPFAPHEPAAYATRHQDLLKDITAPRPPSFNEEDVSDKSFDMSHQPPLTQEQIANIDEYYRKRVLSMLAVDEMIKEVFVALEESGELENTYVIFTSDQGFHLGEHREYQGKSSLYEEDIIVPFVVFGPQIAEGKSITNLLTGTIDIAPTIAEWAGVTPPSFVDGSSFASVLQDANIPSDWRKAFLLEVYSFSTGNSESELLDGNKLYDAYIGNPLKLLYVPPKTIGLRTLDYTYIEEGDGFRELYDLQQDPYQLENIAASADARILDDFSSLLKRLENCKGKNCK